MTKNQKNQLARIKRACIALAMQELEVRKEIALDKEKKNAKK